MDADAVTARRYYSLGGRLLRQIADATSELKGLSPDLSVCAALPEVMSGQRFSLLADLLSEAFQETWTDATVLESLMRTSDVNAVYAVENTVAGTIVATGSSRYLPDRFPGAEYVHWVGADLRYAG